MGIRERLQELLREAPEDAEVIEFDLAWWTWGELRQVVGVVSRALDEAGVGPAGRVGLVLENRPEHVAALVAVLATGRVVVTLSPLQPAARLAADIARAELPVVVGSAARLAGIEAVAAESGLVLELAPDGTVRTLAGAAPAAAATAPGTAIEMLTSGTTGPPKRVLISERQLDESLSTSGQTRRAKLLSRAVTVAATPMVHIGGMWRIVGALSAGRRIALMGKFAVEPWVAAVERHRPRAAGLVPAGMRSILDAGVPRERLASLQVVTSGTTVCPPELADRFHRTYGIRVLMTYGATEFAGAVAGWTNAMHERWWPTKAGSAGRAFGDTELRVTAADGAVLGPDVEGRLEVRSRQSASGAAEWVRTSDLARLDADGFLWITGRADDAIVRGGFKIQPATVAAVLEAHPAVREAAVAGLPDARLGAVPVAAVELVPGAEVDRGALVATLTARCRAELTPYEVPARLLVVDELPRTPSMKVSRVDLLELVARSAEDDEKDGTSMAEDATPQPVDEAFIRRALVDADLNALRMALYQATGDRELLELELGTLPMYGGALNQVVVEGEDVERVKQKAVEFLLGFDKAAFTETVPSDPELKEMYEAFRAETLDERTWNYRRDLAAFDEHPRLARWSGERPEIPADFRVAIIGAGFNGIAMGVQLQKLGIPYTIYERRSDLGGTWNINAYPDVRVDTTIFLYQFFFEKNYPWTEYFARADEVKGYLVHVARKFGVADHISYDSEVTAAVFDAESGTWALDVTVAGEEKHLRATAVVSATGTFATPKKLDVPGIEDFRGRIVHTAECTGDEEIEGRRVAIIGNGSTGVQMMSSVQRRAARLGVYQRTPQWISPRDRYGDPIRPEDRWLLDTMPYYWNWYCYSIATLRLDGQLLQEPDPEWKAQGGQVNAANDSYREDLTRYIRATLPDRPDLWAKLTPAHAPLARRMIVDNNWYSSLLEDNVELVTEGIERFTPTGIRAADGTERDYDLVFTATGFLVQKYMWPTEYRGLGGVRLEDRWSDPEGGGPRAYLSLTMPDFPNLYVMYGPNSQNRAGSLIVWIETWSRYIAESLIHLIETGHRYAVVREDVFADYNKRLDEAMLSLIWYDEGAKDRNYYVNEFGRQQVNIPWRLEQHHELLARFDPDDYDVV